MFGVVTNEDNYYKNMPVVGMTGMTGMTEINGLNQFYTIPGLNNMMNTQVQYQLYNPYTGAIGPTLSDTNNGLNSLNVNINSANIKSDIYERNGILVALVGTQSDINKASNCLDTHLSTINSSGTNCINNSNNLNNGLMISKQNIESQLQTNLINKINDIDNILKNGKSDAERAKDLMTLIVNLL